MNSYFSNMNEAYIEKNYRNRSVFETFAKKTKKASVGVYLFFCAILAGCVYGIIWSQGSIANYKESGDTEMLQVGNIICNVFVIVALIAVFCIGLTIWRSKRGGGDWLKISAAHSKLSESEIREFEQQAMASDSYILKLTSGGVAALSGGKDGILTRDFIFLADLDLTVIPCKSLISACMVESTYYVGDTPNRKPMPYLAIYLLSKSGVESFAEVSPEAGKALIELLLQKNPQLSTFDSRVVTSKEYEDYKKKLVS